MENEFDPQNSSADAPDRQPMLESLDWPEPESMSLTATLDDDVQDLMCVR
jgi:hypothetical protein